MSAEVFNFDNAFLAVSQVLVILRVLPKVGVGPIPRTQSTLSPKGPNTVLSYTY